MPPGLWIKPLPCADDIRVPPETNCIKAPDEVVDAMRVIVQQLQLPKAVYDPNKYPNPSLQWFYRILQALALEEDLPEQAEDKTLPRWRQIHKRAGQYVVDFGQVLDQHFRQWQQSNDAQGLGAKRSTTGANGTSSSRKKVKQEGGDDDTGGTTDDDMRTAYQRDALNSFTVADLKTFCQNKGVSVSGKKKADYVNAVTGWFETKMEVG